MRPNEAKITNCDWLKMDQLEGGNFARWSTTLKDTILNFFQNLVLFLIGQKSDHKIKMIMVFLRVNYPLW